MTDSQQDGPARLSTGSQQPQPGAGNDGLRAVAANLSRYHREHEKWLWREFRDRGWQVMLAGH